MASPAKATSTSSSRPPKRKATPTNQPTGRNKNTNGNDALAEPAAKRHRGARNSQAKDYASTVNNEDDVDPEEPREPEREATLARGAHDDEMARLKGVSLFVIIIIHGLTL
jgi:hypothetical protein